MSEVRMVSATGGEKGQKPSQLGAIDPLALYHLGEVAGFGAQKYAAFNYLRGYDWNLNVDAAFRHFLLMWMGQDRDAESGLLHAAHFAWHGLALTSFQLRGLGTDNRFIQPGLDLSNIEAITRGLLDELAAEREETAA